MLTSCSSSLVKRLRRSVQTCSVTHGHASSERLANPRAPGAPHRPSGRPTAPRAMTTEWNVRVEAKLDLVLQRVEAARGLGGLSTVPVVQLLGWAVTCGQMVNYCFHCGSPAMVTYLAPCRTCRSRSTRSWALRGRRRRRRRRRRQPAFRGDGRRRFPRVYLQLAALRLCSWSQQRAVQG